MAFENIAGSAGGWCDPKAKRIVVDAHVPANAQLRTLIHECAHALGVDYQRYSRAQSEVIVDTVTFLAASSVGLAVDGETIPYVAGWGEDGALQAVTEFAASAPTRPWGGDVARRRAAGSVQRQLGQHADLGITSAYLRGIDSTETSTPSTSDQHR